jgi:hypothetical protein
VGRSAVVAAAANLQIPVKGPDFLAFGALSNPLRGSSALPEGPADRMGFNNAYALEVAKRLVRDNRLPDFLYVYLPDQDRRLHRNGPPGTEGAVRLDGQLWSLLESFGSPEEALQRAVIIVVGDSGVAQLLPAGREPVIELHRILRDFRLLPPDGRAADDTEIALAVNETMAYVYKLSPRASLKDIAEALAGDSRIDFVAWKESGWYYVRQGGTSRGMRYKPGGDAADPYGQTWTLEQDAAVLDVTVDRSGRRLAYGRYPDGLRRLSAALDSHTGPFLIVSAKPGFEFADRRSPTHSGGGGHGSLHETESLVPLIIAGTDRKPDHLRIVDLKSWILRLAAGL